MMTPERLTEIRRAWDEWNGMFSAKERAMALADAVLDLLDHIDELTTQRDDARRIAVCSGIFQDHRGEDYAFDSEHEYTWRADDVGPVAWNRQVEQQ